jgi:serine/threonine protein kinase
MRFTYQTGAQPLAGYTIQRGIHRGGFGEVYFAHSDGGKEVALKLIHRQDQDVEIRGVKQCLNLKHPNLVNLFDLKTDASGDHWVVMEYVSGTSLEDVLASFPDGLPINEVREWLSGLVAGVSHLHDRGIVHRDLKPANVYRENGVVKVGDVGLSKRIDSDHRRQHTQSVGTVYYMAPEVARGEYGPEVDVYSLGVMLYELITGKLPFNGETTAEILMKHLTAQPDLTPIPKPLRPAIARALEKDPRKRTPTARVLERDFMNGIAGRSEPLDIPETAFLPPVPPQIPRQSMPDVTRGSSEEFDRQSPSLEGVRNKSSSSGDNNVTASKNTRNKLIIVIAILVFWTGLTHQKTSFVTFLVGLGLAIYYSNKTRASLLHSNSQRRGRPLRSEPAHTYRTYQSVSSKPNFGRGSNVATKPIQIDRPWSERWAETANSLGLAGLIASLLSVGIYLWPAFREHRGVAIPSSEHAILFAATSIVGSWLFLIGHAFTSGSEWTNRQRWLVRLGTGILLGTFASAMDEFLMLKIPSDAFTARGAISKIADYSLTRSGGDPSWLGYCCFFAGWMGIRRWSHEIDDSRTKGLRIWTLIGSMTIAYVISMIFRFPQWYAILWSGAISTTVQLASSWSPMIGTGDAGDVRGFPDPAQATDRRSRFQPAEERG